MRRAGLIHDDRGREVPVYRPGLLSFHRDDELTFPEGEFQEFRRRLARADPAGCFGGQTLVWLVGLYFGVRLVWGLATQPFPVEKVILRLLLLAALVVLAVLAQRRILPLEWKRHPGIIRDVLLGMGRCASCGFDLRGTQEAEDGLRVCPECGAAWHVAKRETQNVA